MIPRMTTVGTLKNYRYDLNKSNNIMNKAMNTLLSGRLFNSFAEDPALATRCFQIRKSYWAANNQLEVNDSLRHKYDVAWESLSNMSTDLYALADDASYSSVLRALSDPTGPGRIALGQSLEAKAKDLAQIMNGRYGENYVFAGADTLNAPFTWGAYKNSAYIEGTPDPANPEHAAAFPYLKADGTPTDNAAGDAEMVLLENQKYDEAFTKEVDDAVAQGQADHPGLVDPRYGKYLKEDGMGTMNDAEAKEVPKENPAYNETTSFKYLKSDGTGTNLESEAAQVLHYRGVPVDSNNPADVKKMEYFLKGESKYIDVGLGHKEADDGVISSTVFDSALQGIYYTGGYGTKNGVDATITHEDGSKETMTVDNIPQNVISIVHEMGQILQRCRVKDGEWNGTEEMEEWGSREDQFRFKALVDEFEKSCGSFRERWTEMDTQTGFLRDNSELLTNKKDSLQQQYMELEDADPAAAISDFMFARYCYDAALKVGNSVLSQSLMDYMNL